jgi:S1-C subfamily serine protease
MNASIKLLEGALPAVVSLRTDVDAQHPSSSVLGTERHGSGVLVDSTDLVLTVNYVVLGARDVEVTFLDGTAAQGTVAAQDLRTGVALVRLRSPAKRGLPTRSSLELDVGDDVAIIAAAAENSRRVSDGVALSFGRFDANWEYALERSIVTTARNPGLGGAPLIDVFGRVVGIISLDLGEVGRSTLAIPVDYYLENRDELLRHGRCVSRRPRAWIGIFCYTFRDHVIVAGLLPGAPAERAGLKPGDVVLALDGQEIGGRKEFYETLWSSPPGRLLEFRVFRNDAVVEVGVTGDDAERFFA